MKKYLFNLYKFVVFTSLFYIVFIIITGLFAPGFASRNLIYNLGGNGFMYTRLKEIRQIDTLDLLILGSSRAYRGFDVRIFDSIGLKTFNLGSSNQTPIQTLMLLNRYLNKIHPKIIIFEVNPDIFSNTGTEAAIDLLSNDKIAFDDVKMAVEINNIKVYNTLIFASFIDIVGNRKNFSENSNSASDNYITNGYVASELTTYSDEKTSTYSCDILEAQLISFEKIVRLIQSLKIKLILVQSPVLSTTYDQCRQNELFDQKMNSAGYYLNFNSILSLDPIHFIDNQHLNQRGVEIFNRKLIELIF